MKKLLKPIKIVLKAIFLQIKDYLYKLGLFVKDTTGLPYETIQNFIALNTPNWDESKFNANQYILVEGHLAQYGPNYLARTAVAAKKLEEMHKLPIIVIFPGYAHQWHTAEKLYRSFGITQFIYIKSNLGLIRNAFIFASALLQSRSIFSSIQQPKDIINISIDNTIAGDLIYDEILRYDNIPTITDIGRSTWLNIFKSLQYWKQYQYFLSRKNYRFFVSTHAAYTEYGLLVRSAIKNGATVIETTDSVNTIHDQLSADNLPTYHQGMKNVIKRYLQENSSETTRQIIIQEAKNNLEQRLSGNLNQIDVALAYKDKKQYDDKSLRDALNISNDKPFVFVFAHAFVDSPHISSWQLYNDYYAWLEETLNIIKDIDSCNWIVKPHPSASLYNETGKVESMVESLNSDYVFLSPEDMSPSTVVQCSTAIVTVQGTVAIEYACFSIPVVITGAAFFSNLGFTLEPHSVTDYLSMLKNLHNEEKLSAQQTSDALLVYGIWNSLSGYTSDIIDQDLLANVWGYNGEPDLHAAYQNILSKMKDHSFAQLDVARFIGQHCA